MCAAQVHQAALRQHIDGTAVRENVFIHLGLERDLLHPRRRVQAGHLDLVVEMPDVADDGLVLHPLHVFQRDDIAVSGAGDIDVGFAERVLHRRNLEALHRGLLSERDLDQALRGKFRLFINLGLLDPPERVPYAKIGREAGPEPWNDSATRAFVREVTRRSIVLLRNDQGLLPIDPAKIKSVAVVGPMANTVLLDYYSGTPPYRVSPREGIEDYAQPFIFGPAKFDTNWAADMSDVAIEEARKRYIAVV